MTERIPLVTMLSQAFVAYTIEFDNEAEHRLQHRTTQHGGKLHSPWLVSMVMWFNCMQFLDKNGLPVAELFRRARTRTNLDGCVAGVTLRSPLIRPQESQELLHGLFALLRQGSKLRKYGNRFSKRWRKGGMTDLANPK